MSAQAAPPTIIFQELDLRVSAQAGETLLSCIRRVGLSVDSTCNGRGACGNCVVKAEGDLTPPDETEREHLLGHPPEARLACRARALGNVRVTLPERLRRLKSAWGRDDVKIHLDSPMRRVELPAAACEASRPYVEGLSLRTNDPRVLNRIALHSGNASSLFGIALDDELVDIGADREPLLGAAVDVGTTGLSLCLFDLESGKLMGRASALNPQVSYGGDVVTRISYCRQEPEGLSTLRAVVANQLEAMLDELPEPLQGRTKVRLMTVAANTTMQHILAGVAPVSLALAPFRPIFLNSLTLDGERSGLPIHPHGRCILLPGASAYVGSDIIAGLIAIDYHSLTGTTLFIDIGTNGEIALIEGPERIIATSCAMGPALEGMNISCGCRATPGAVSSFSLDDDLSPIFSTIEDQPPEGICGSGLIDLIAALVQAGLISPSGAFSSKADPRLLARLRDNRYYLTDEVFLSQKDIRQVQLAKGAMLAGIRILLEEAGRTVGEIDRIIVGGSFGYHLRTESLKLTGLIPGDCRCPLSYVGNSSLTGAALALLNKESLKKMERLAAMVRIVDLGSHKDFSAAFTSNLRF